MADIDTTAFDQAWDRLEAWLEAHSPDDHSTLQPPATDAEILTLQEELGFPLHPELTALLKRHNGTVEHRLSRFSPPFPAGAFLPLGHRLIGTEGIAYGHREIVGIEEQYPNTDFWDEDSVEGHRKEWVYFAVPNDGGLAFIDHHPGPTYGHVYEYGLGSGAVEATKWASGLTEFISGIATSLADHTPYLGSRPGTFQHGSGAHCVSWRTIL
ncbi:SMI1/KNR4 family protein [Streptomyces tsukubensis]|uniref:SMI1/KNR4 family protein n=1 Tax=Streptomyces tsukubensis TaxID=83656 RepID=UPI00344FEE36